MNPAGCTGCGFRFRACRQTFPIHRRIAVGTASVANGHSVAR